MEKNSNDLEGTISQQVAEMSLSPETVEKTEVVTKSEKFKIDILLKATGNAPIMKKKKWAVDSDKEIRWISEFVRKYLKLEICDQLFLYVNQTFAPSPDQMIRNLYDCYGSDGRLVLHYCITQAWG